MPSITELLTSAGVDLKGVDADKLDALVEQSDKVIGLVAAKTDLHAWKETNKPIIDAREVEIQTQKDQAALDLKAREDLAIENKDFKAQLEIQVERENVRNAELATLKESNKLRTEESRKSLHESGLTKVESLFNDAVMGRDVASNRVSTITNEDGTVTQSYNLGDKTFDKFEDLQVAMVANASYAAGMKAPNSSGANTVGHNSIAGNNNDTNAAAEAAKTKGDAIGTLNERLKGIF